MLSRLQELKKEEETLLKVKALLLDQLNRLKIAMQVDDESKINQTELQLNAFAVEQGLEEEQQQEEEEEEEEDN
ncbi:UNVERIFIED_CONTAM: hypothetical protein FKN15_039449 [Acipenser sinensis]